MEIKVHKKICQVVFEDKDKYEDLFARELARNGFHILEAFEKSFYQVNKIRASYMLQNISCWQKIFTELILKKNPTQKEIDWIDEYNSIIESYDLNPFELFNIYVTVNQNTGIPIIESIGSDNLKTIQVLIVLFNFFSILDRPKFLDEIKIRLRDQYKSLSDNDLKSFNKSIHIIKKSFDIDVEEIINLAVNDK